MPDSPKSERIATSATNGGVTKMRNRQLFIKGTEVNIYPDRTVSVDVKPDGQTQGEVGGWFYEVAIDWEPLVEETEVFETLKEAFQFIRESFED